jgi:predicted RNA binding protein YcfA (HicA-like mRNA interferase family)
MKVSELKKLLKSHGCYDLASGKRHDTWYSPITKAKFRVPRHQSAEVPDGTLSSILKQAGI